MHTEWKEKDRKGDLIAKKEGTDRGGKRDLAMKYEVAESWGFWRRWSGAVGGG